MMVDVVPDRDRVRAFSLNYWAINLGFASAAILAGFAATSTTCCSSCSTRPRRLITAAIVFVKMRETRPVGAHLVGATRAVAVSAWSCGTGCSWSSSFANLLAAMVFLQHISMLPIAMTDDGLSSSTFGWVIALNGVLIVLGQLLHPEADRRSRPGPGARGRRRSSWASASG